VGSLVYRDLFSAAVNAARCSSYSLGFSIVTRHPYGPGRDATFLSVVFSELIHTETLQLLEEVYLSDKRKDLCVWTLGGL
jgi:hypothetical protein